MFVLGYKQVLRNKVKNNTTSTYNSQKDLPSDFSDDSCDEYVPSSSKTSFETDEDITTRKEHKIVTYTQFIEESENRSNSGEVITTTSTSQIAPVLYPDVLQNYSNSKVEVTSGNKSKIGSVIQPTSKRKNSTEQEGTRGSLVDSIKIKAAKHYDGKRVRNKRHSCYFCQKLIIHMAQHLELCHGKELGVAKLLAMAKNSKSRKEGFLELVRAGDFFHNCNVVSAKEGELILVRRPTKNEALTYTYRNYGPCPHCLGYMLKKHLWHHIKKKCCRKPTNNNKLIMEPNGGRHVIAESNAILSCIFGNEFSEDFRVHILNRLRDDDIGSYCREDILIKKFGAMLFEKHGLTQCEMIRQNMRQLARLTLELRQTTLEDVSLNHFFICRSQQNNSTKRPEFQIPSLALKLGYALKKCANIQRGTALRQGDLKNNDLLLSFLQLMELEWCFRISSNALVTLSQRKFNVGQLLPVTSDLKKINEYISTESERAKRALKESVNIQNWSRLCMLTLCRIILFNKRRSGEAAKISLEQYHSRPNWNQETTEELKNSLSPYEIKLAERLCVINITGKRGRKVPIILTPIMKNSINLLLEFRERCGISENNPYVFARGNQSIFNVRGHDCLRKIILELEPDLEKPDYITGTKLRKYVATVCQVFSLTENEHDWLARHLGHDITVHREFYRLHEDAVELTKISRLLMAVESGETSKFKGMNLKDIQIEELPGLQEEDDYNSEDDITVPESLEDSTITEPPEYNGEMYSANESMPPQTNIIKRTAVLPSRKKTIENVHYKRKGEKKPWTSEEKTTVFKYFNIHIQKDITPRQKDCTEFLEKHPELSKRKWSDIKFCVKKSSKKNSKKKVTRISTRLLLTSWKSVFIN
ncbi:hypothetical protein NQ314_004515 [Rhamnusium bicolor]|uniref:Uncharacterized protein n=1 Tax=Rhamnusium bicolor TaxID=1586634 RepID=A0AAV8ZKY3_9CUCU|nr:hypothetical protein NQ314_004515 [Rhamnusium bicolor]